MKRLILLIMTLLTVPALGAITRGDSASTYGTGSLTVTATSGGLLIACVSGAVEQIATISDGVNTWHSLTAYADANTGGRIYYAYNVVGGSTTISISSAPGDGGWSVMAYSGIKSDGDPFDKGIGAAAPSGATFTSTATGTTTQNDELLIGLWASEVGDAAPVASGWWQRTKETAHVHYTFDKIVSSTGGYAFSGTMTSGSDAIAIIATFKGDGAAPPATAKKGKRRLDMMR